jgi:hypothetical protein
MTIQAIIWSSLEECDFFKDVRARVIVGPKSVDDEVILVNWSRDGTLFALLFTAEEVIFNYGSAVGIFNYSDPSFPDNLLKKLVGF